MEGSIRTRICTCVCRILRRYGYPPDEQEEAIQTVLQQAELLSESWAT
jgi:type I restriction enzyme R subunit